MKPIQALSGALISLLLAIPASARHACVSISDASAESQQLSDRIVPPSVARLVLAQRLGLSGYHSLGGADDDAIEFLNAHSTHQEQDQARRKVLLFVEGVDEPDILASKHHSEAFKIDNPPVGDFNTQFLEDFSRQSYQQSRLGQSCQGAEFTIPSDLKNQKSRTAGCHTYLHTSLDKPLSGPVTASNIHSVLSNLRSSADASSADLITVFIPSQASTSLFKRSAAPQPWGSSNLARQAPAPESPEDTNNEAEEPDAPSPTHASGIKGILEDLEDIFDSEDGTTSSIAAEPTRPSIEDGSEDDEPDRPKRPTRPTASSSASARPSNTSPPKGILPQCYTSRSECNRATHHCSGHGTCEQKYDLSHPSSLKRRQDSDDDDTSRPGSGVSTKTKCFSCVCGITSRVDDQNRNKTTKWAGPACQKKDVSMPFWLLGGTTIGLVGVIGWAVGLLYGMGSEELPSVIGAGVAGLGAISHQ